MSRIILRTQVQRKVLPDKTIAVTYTFYGFEKVEQADRFEQAMDHDLLQRYSVGGELKTVKW